MQYTIDHQPDYALLRVLLQSNEQIFSEPSAMASMDTNIRLKSGLRGGLLKSIGRMFGGENLITNTFTALNKEGEVLLAPGTMGDIFAYPLNGGSELILRRGAFLACTRDVKVDSKWGGVSGFFSGTGLILLRAHGNGNIFFNTYGALIEVNVQGDYLVDTGYLAAFENTLHYEITTLPGLSLGGRFKSFLFGGEGLVCKFQGQGKVWIQTRNVNSFLNWIHPFRPVQKRNWLNNLQGE